MWPWYIYLNKIFSKDAAAFIIFCMRVWNNSRHFTCLGFLRKLPGQVTIHPQIIYHHHWYLPINSFTFNCECERWNEIFKLEHEEDYINVWVMWIVFVAREVAYSVNMHNRQPAISLCWSADCWKGLSLVIIFQFLWTCVYDPLNYERFYKCNNFGDFWTNWKVTYA